MATVTDGQPRSSGRTPAAAGETPATAPGAADRASALLAPTRPHPPGDRRRYPPGDSPLRFTVPAHPSRAAVVRRRVTDHLTRLGLPEELCDSVVLATDELFANAVTHTGTRPYDTVTLTVELIRDAVRVMVADPSPVPPLLRTVDGGAESGRGLAIVSVLADAWGVAPAEPGKPGKRVWFTLARTAPPEATT